jgi:hypothetical protein
MPTTAAPKAASRGIAVERTAEREILARKRDRLSRSVTLPSEVDEDSVSMGMGCVE